MQNLFKKEFLDTIKHKKVLAAVSGGVDSMVMLDLLIKEKPKCKFSLEVMHVNHNLRGEHSNNDAKLVEKVCQNHNIVCQIESVDVLEYKNENKLTIEEAARVLRHNIISKYAKQNKIDYVLFAHNAGDQAETVLMHIARGSGLAGASGIRKRDGILRPLLHVDKKVIYDYAKLNNIEYHEDHTNVDIKYSRNFVRHEILPKFAEAYPNIQDNIARFARTASVDDDYILSTIDFSVIEKCDVGYKLPVSSFLKHEAVYSRLIRRCVNMLGIYADIEKKHIDAIVGLLQMKNGNTICLPHGLLVQKEYEYVFFMLNNNKIIQTHLKKFHLGQIEYSDKYTIVVDEIEHEEVCFGDGNLYFDLDSIPHHVIFRKRKPADLFKKFGSGTKTLSDYLTDKKIPQCDRQNLIVLASEKNVLLVVGVEISETIKITDGTTRVGRLSLITKK